MSLADKIVSIRETVGMNYTKPSLEKLALLRDNLAKFPEAIDYWENVRGFSKETIEHFKLGYDSDKKAVSIPIFKKGELVNIKYRFLNPKETRYTSEKNCETWLFNEEGIDKAKEKGGVLIVEGECFPKGTEILTENGFVKFENYNGEKVAQFMENGVSEFVNPIHIVKKKYNDDLVVYRNDRGFLSKTTKDHNLVFKSKRGEYIKYKAIDKIPHTLFIPRTTTIDNIGVDLTDDEIRFCVAVSADFTIRESRDLYAIFTRDRKKLRIEKLLEKLKIPYKTLLRGDKKSYFISRKNTPKYVFKLFPSEWIGKLSLKQRKVIIDELLYWDGNSVPNRNQIEYSSKEIHNASFIQTVSSTSGYMSTIIPRSNSLGRWYKVSILFGKQYTSTQKSLKKEFIKYNDYVYCVKVPSGMIVVRQNNCISVSGNCDLMATWQTGITNVVSPASGKDSYGVWLELLDNIPKVYIAYDNDKPGKEASLKLAERLGVEKCMEVSYPEGTKDANEYFKKYTKDEFKEMLKNAKPFYHYQFKGIGDVLNTLRFKKNETIKVDLIPKVEIEKDWMIVVSGVSNVGKSAMVLNVASQFLKQGIPTLVLPFERGIETAGKRFLQIEHEKTLADFGNLNDSEWETITQKCVDTPLYFAMPKRDDVVATIVKSKRIFDTKVVIIDHLDYLIRHVSGNKEAEIGNTLQDLKRVAEENGIIMLIVTHIRKIDGAGGTTKRDPGIEDLKGSSSLYQDPECVVMLTKSEENKLKVSVVKNKGLMVSQEYQFNPLTGKLGASNDGWNGF